MSLTDELCRSYLDLRWHFDPAAASQVGLTEHDGRLGHFDTEMVDEHLAAYRALEASATVDAALARLRGIPVFVDEATAAIRLSDPALPPTDTAVRLIGAAEALVISLGRSIDGLLPDEDCQSATQAALPVPLVRWGMGFED